MASKKLRQTSVKELKGIVKDLLNGSARAGTCLEGSLRICVWFGKLLSLTTVKENHSNVVWCCCQRKNDYVVLMPIL